MARRSQDRSVRSNLKAGCNKLLDPHVGERGDEGCTSNMGLHAEESIMDAIDVEKLVDNYRIMFGPMTSGKADGLTFLANSINADQGWSGLNQAAYFLSTIKWETAH